MLDTGACGVRPTDPGSEAMPSRAGSARERSLRDKAEGLLKKKGEVPLPVSPDDRAALTHELQVHQIELEMQNEELRRSQGEILASQARHADLYDFGPVGYCTLDSHGMILQANLTAASLLGQERSLLKGTPFVRFVARDCRDAFHLFRRSAMEGAGQGPCEVEMSSTPGERFHVALRALAVKDPLSKAARLNLAFDDITPRKRAEEALLRSHEELEVRVRERTAELEKANLRLLQEMEERQRATQKARAEQVFREAVER